MTSKTRTSPKKKGGKKVPNKAVKKDKIQEIMSKSLTDDEEGIYLLFHNRLKSDTENKLTATEYEHLARMELFLYMFDKKVKADGIDNIDTSLIDTARRYREKILAIIGKCREKVIRDAPLLQQLKELTRQGLKIEYTPPEVD